MLAQGGGRVDAELMELLQDILARSVVDKRSADLIGMSLRDRHVAAALCAEKFRLFQSLFARQDFGIRATMKDLENVDKYVENTRAIMERTMTWKAGWDHLASALIGWMGCNDLRQTIMENYQTGKAAYESQQARLSVAGNAVFPAVSFDALADGVNLFYQNMLVQLRAFG
jgi:hypothetical protein